VYSTVKLYLIFFVCINNQIIVRSSCYEIKTKKEYLVMSESPKKKLCWNCETRVTISQENCTFCGVYLSPTSEHDNENILRPPYRIQSRDDKFEIPGSPYNQSELDEEVNDASEASVNKNETLSIKLVMMTIVFLFLGSIFLLFSTLMLVFSQNGMLILKWSTDYWYIYLSLAVPLLFLGWKGLSRIPDNA